jgi:hypothetical protein
MSVSEITRTNFQIEVVRTERSSDWNDSPGFPGSDATSMLLASAVELGDGQVQVAQDAIKSTGTRREAKMEQAWQELLAARAAANQKSSWSSFGSVCRVVGIGASIALAGATGGSSLLVTATLIGMSVAARPVLEKAGLNPTLVDVGGFKLTLVDAAVIGGGCAGGGGSDGGIVAVFARGGLAGSSAGQAVATEREGHYASQEMHRQADARSCENDAAHQLRMMKAAIARFREGMEFRQRALQAIAEIYEIQGNTTKALVGRRA